jgi:hypothetical protein
MKFYLTNHRDQFKNELIRRMQTEVNKAKHDVIRDAKHELGVRMEKIMADYGVEISSFVDDYDMSYKIKVELITPREEVKDDSNSS